ncbi:hypothetical protein CPT_Moonbeam169 [Bacillus phage Moonbeam]|uniref:Uncharacterized protein n=1 Tax=Bacillus phage Moonbeam TaxID=1540091 RepID=A0A0A0RNI1_9CAUD|nr:hypothetical protein CPT_Moonbeam169 [Bacillus phage Moonbeam]AIW03567.1 hypothetical protein CPT_Moonbeam169 [Bacillus phage Moonbeam]
MKFEKLTTGIEIYQALRHTMEDIKEIEVARMYVVEKRGGLSKGSQVLLEERDKLMKVKEAAEAHVYHLADKPGGSLVLGVPDRNAYDIYFSIYSAYKKKEQLLEGKDAIANTRLPQINAATQTLNRELSRLEQELNGLCAADYALVRFTPTKEEN